MRNLCAALLATVMVTTSAWAAGADGALAPGKPAGVKLAQSGATVAAIVGGTGIVAMVAALASHGGGGGSGANNQNNGTTSGITSTTTST
jgi:hypothetical protein